MDFNYDRWEKLCTNFQKNKEGCGFDIEVKIVDGQLKTKILNLDEKYSNLKKTFSDIVIAIAQGGIAVLYNMMRPTYVYSMEDKEEEDQKASQIIDDNLETFMEILLRKGMNPFLALVGNYASLMKHQYLFTKLHYVEGTWELPDGKRWMGDAWADKEGIICYDSSVEVLKPILS